MQTMLRLRTIIALAIVAGFITPYCAGNPLFSPKARAEMHEEMANEHQHSEHDKQCDGCFICFEHSVYAPNRGIIDIKDSASLFMGNINFSTLRKEEPDIVSSNNTESQTLFADARLHASSIVKRE